MDASNPVPVDRRVARFVAGLDVDAREFFEECAAILEFEAGLARAEAERQAYALTCDYLARRRSGSEGRDVD